MEYPWPVYGSELRHFGIKGQKWGVRRYQNEDGSLTSEGKKRKYRQEHNARKTSIRDDPVRKKEYVKSMHNEAVDRATFYGGKNVAINAIKDEARYAKFKNRARSAAVVGASAGFATVAALSSVPIAAVPAATIGVGHAVYTSIKNQRITDRAKAQEAYTKDVDFDVNKLKKYS